MLSVKHLIILLVGMVSYRIGANRQAKHDLDVARRKLGPYITKRNSGQDSEKGV